MRDLVAEVIAELASHLRCTRLGLQVEHVVRDAEAVEVTCGEGGPAGHAALPAGEHHRAAHAAASTAELASQMAKVIPA